MARMSRVRRSLLVLLPALLALSASAAPFVPRSDDEVLEILPASSREERELRALRDALAETPKDLSLALQIAWRYVELGRRSGDPRHHGWAAGVARSWLTLSEPPSEVLVLRATLRQNRHEFTAALEDLSRVLARNPRDARAWLNRATILQVQGRLSEARRSCTRLLANAEPLAAVSCLSRVGAVSGNARRAFEVLDEAVASQGASPAMRRFALTSLAEIASQLGRDEEAERRFHEVLASGEPDAYGRAGYADFLLDRGRAQEVVDLIDGTERSDGLLLRRVLAGMQLGAVWVESDVRALQARHAAARGRGESLHLGDEARFVLYVLGQPREALQLALANFASQREPRDVRVLLEAALAAGDPEAARPALAFLHETGLEDAALERLVRRLEGS